MAAKRRRTTDPKTGRFQSVLTPELVERLCKVHAEGKDFKNVTAARCGVHPKMLLRWLALGRDNENAGLATDLFMRFLAIEGEIRAEWIGEVADTTQSVEQTEFENGRPVSKTVTSRRTAGVQWLLGVRFNQFRVEHVVTPEEQDTISMLQPQAQALTSDMALQLCQQLAANPERLPAQIRALFAATDWRAPKTLEAHGQETSH